jgi:hypothetical protein
MLWPRYRDVVGPLGEAIRVFATLTLEQRFGEAAIRLPPEATNRKPTKREARLPIKKAGALLRARFLFKHNHNPQPLSRRSRIPKNEAS